MDNQERKLPDCRLDVETLEIAGLHSVLEALHLPFNGKNKSESQANSGLFIENKGDVFFSTSRVGICQKDIDLIHKLIKAGDEHGKVIRGMQVWAKITAPRMVWGELDTYRVGTERLSSESTMHTIGKGNLTIRNFDVPKEIAEILDYTKEVKEIQPLHFDEPEQKECKVVERYGRKYEVWNNGEIYSLPYSLDEELPNGSKRHREFPKIQLKIGKTRNMQGYYQVHIGGRKGKAYPVHRLMAEAFVPNPKGYPVVNHKDGNKGNCSPSNLEWCTSSYNNKHAFDNGLKEVTPHAKYLLYKKSLKFDYRLADEWKRLRASGMTLAEIAEKYDSSVSAVMARTSDYDCWGTSNDSKLFEECKKYEDAIEELNNLSCAYEEENGSIDVLLDIKRKLMESFLQTRIQVFSYQTLRRIYFQRRNHRLPHWHKFCDWIETLPFAKEWITFEK